MSNRVGTSHQTPEEWDFLRRNLAVALGLTFTIDIRVVNDLIRVDNATVGQTDVLADNRIIHVIDSVILP